MKHTISDRKLLPHYRLYNNSIHSHNRTKLKTKLQEAYKTSKVLSTNFSPRNNVPSFYFLAIPKRFNSHKDPR